MRLTGRPGPGLQQIAKPLSALYQGQLDLSDLGGAMTKMPEPVIHSDPNILGGTPVFVGTRVPAQSLFDYLEAGESLAAFLEAFPTVTKDQAVAALELACDKVLAVARPA
jgi:uncharacterized protein (DUF433 family)